MNDDTDQACAATASGIMHCLRMLADEAATLNLSRTLMAIHEALETCQMENGEQESPRAVALRSCLH